ncbi:hypothetical protein SAMN04489761_3386 [Tenacibaculum sp. MAR_2009_124]|uniref:hypothetical protein n=1 Tax=Tenacibaculum sp. MAR_2009_124 TaxID=1250059 RepID=UPI0008966E79|nr:hypothetical protein [Tenacibaculum sp. MAR_2009_124]SEC64633.1 hypothetical protein SAMN04489761_3386 [Tenacibaculum sp. MAR_2009_124]
MILKKKVIPKGLSVNNFSFFFFEIMWNMQDEKFRDFFIKKVLTYRPHELVGMLEMKLGHLDYSTVDRSELTKLVQDCIINFEDYMKDYFKIKYHS